MKKFDDYSIEEVKKMLKKFNDERNCSTILLAFLGIIITISVVALVVLKIRERFEFYDDFDDDFDDDDYYDLDYDDDDSEDGGKSHGDSHSNEDSTDM